MAAVYEATHDNGYRVAMKFLLDRHLDEAEAHQLFRREAYVANKVGHPGAVPVLDNDVDEEGCPFLVMPLLEGEPVRKRWERAQKRLPLAEACVFMADTLDVLASAHARGIVHRDIKPDNLFLTAKGEVCVLDFGVARWVEADSLVTATGRVYGTPAFMPPEQALGERAAVGPRSDCWAVGATMFMLISGELVHGTGNAQSRLVAAATKRARSITEVSAELPPPIASVFDKALAFEPADRWGAAYEMREALVRAMEEGFGESFASMARRIRDGIVSELAPRRGDEPELETRAGALAPPKRSSDMQAEPPHAESVASVAYLLAHRSGASSLGRAPRAKPSAVVRTGVFLAAASALIAAGFVLQARRPATVAPATTVAASETVPTRPVETAPASALESASPIADAGAAKDVARAAGPRADGSRKARTAVPASASSLRHGDWYDDGNSSPKR